MLHTLKMFKARINEHGRVNDEKLFHLFTNHVSALVQVRFLSHFTNFNELKNQMKHYILVSMLPIWYSWKMQIRIVRFETGYCQW